MKSAFESDYNFRQTLVILSQSVSDNKFVIIRTVAEARRAGGRGQA